MMWWMTASPSIDRPAPRASRVHLVRCLIVILVALAVAGCVLESRSGGERWSEGGCLWHWNRATNEQVRNEAKTFAGELAVLGRERDSECALQVRTDPSEIPNLGPAGQWELVPDDEDGYEWKRASRDLTLRESQSRSGVIAEDGSFDDQAVPLSPLSPVMGDDPVGPPHPDTPRPVRETPRLSGDRPRQPLIVDTTPDDDSRAFCGRQCGKYKRTRVTRTRVPWIAHAIKDDLATIVYARQQCSGPRDEIVVSGSTVVVYQYANVDPAPRDHFSPSACMLAGGQCGSPCETVAVPLTGVRDPEDLKRAGVPELKPPCNPWPRCWDDAAKDVVAARQ